MLSDNERLQKYRPPQKEKKPGMSMTKRWTDKQKMECCTTYLLMGGNLAMTSRSLNIPERTIRLWKSMDWWKDVISEIQKQEKLELSARLKKVVNTSWDVVEDRLANGDFVYNQKTGELIRKPVSLRDANKAAIDAAKLKVELTEAENFTVNIEQIEDKLMKLAQTFKDLSEGKINKEVHEAEDIEFVEEVEDDEEGDEDAN